MISFRKAHWFCKDDISLIENYEEAVNSEEIWDVHHRDEIRILPSGVIALRSRQELKDNGRYFKCPANELIFMSHTEHAKLHAKYRKCEHSSGYHFTRKHPCFGKPLSEEHKAKLRLAHLGKVSPRKGKHLTDEQKAKLRAANLGKKHTEEERKKISEANKIRWANYRASKEVEHV